MGAWAQGRMGTWAHGDMGPWGQPGDSNRNAPGGVLWVRS